jgi:small-conductance mechanosensitive channel
MPHGSRFGRFVFASISIVAALAIAAASLAQSPPNSTNSSTAPIPAEAAPQPVADKRAENAELLRVAQRRLESGDPTDGTAAQTVALFQSLDAVLAQQQAVEQQIKDLETRKRELEGQLQSATAAAAKASFSFVELDELKDELAAEQARSSLVADKLTTAKSALEKAQSALDDSETKRRQAQEAFDNGKTKENASELAAAADGAVQAARLAAETVTLRKTEVAREKLSREVQRLAVQLCEDRITWLSPLVVFTAADYEAQITAIKKKEDSASKSLLRAQTNLHNAEVQLQQAQKERNAETGDRTIVEEKREAARWAREKLSDEIDSLTQRQQRLAQLRVAWNHRFANASADRSTPDKQAFDELKSWQKETRAILDELAADLRMQILRMRDLRSSVTSITKKLDAAKDGPAALQSSLGEQKRQAEETLRIHESNLVTIETSRRVHEKLLDEIGRDVQILNPTNLALGVWHQAEQIWKLEVTEIAGRSISVGKIAGCLLIFSGGWIFARISSAVLANRILKRFRLSKDATAAVRALVFYSLLVAVAIAALRTVNVPLTAFTILGGALAIGVGFGSQALINNFIGGLIMLAERPVRLGERITFGNYDGVVEDVGFRCTKLRTGNDHLVTIPNSTLVNESIENVARRRTIKRTMNVAIPCDTPRDKVADAVQAIRDVLEEKELRDRIHPIVGFEEFPPRVYFNDLTATNLNIQVVYWYAPTEWWGYMEHSERVNFRIMEEFERLGIEFASPSRTLLLVNEPKRDLAARVA